MANSANNIKESWSLISFAKSHGKPQLGKFINEETGETWKSCIFTDPSNPDNKTFVSFSRNLGELTAQQIKEQKDDLQVVQCFTKEGKKMFSLCKKGAESWEDVDLL